MLVGESDDIDWGGLPVPNMSRHHKYLNPSCAVEEGVGDRCARSREGHVVESAGNFEKFGSVGELWLGDVRAARLSYDRGFVMRGKGGGWK